MVDTVAGGNEPPDAAAERTALLAGVQDTFATLKRCLALTRLHTPDHDTVRDLALQAGAKLKALVDAGDVEVQVDARSVSFRGKPLIMDEGTETAIGTLFASGLAALAFDAALTEESVVTFVRLWGRAADRRVPLSPDHTLTTLMWDAAVPGITLIDRADDVIGDADHQEGLARRQGLLTALSAATPRALPAGAAPPLPILDVDAPLKVLLTRSVSAQQNLGSVDRAPLLALCAGAIATALHSGHLADVADAFDATVKRGQLLVASDPERIKDLEAVCACLANDDVKAALGVVAAGIKDGTAADTLVQVVRYLPRRHVDVLAFLLGQASPAAKEPLSQRLAKVHLTDPEWAGLAEAGGLPALVDLLEVARLRSPAAAAAVAEGARGLSDEAFVAVATKLRGDELAAARDVLVAALTRQATANAAEEALVRLKDPAITQRLLLRLNDDNRPVEQRARAATLLGRLDGEAARAGLRDALVALKNDEVRAAIALALGSLRDQPARPLLEAIAKKFLGDRALKKACGDALKRLDTEVPHE